MLEKCYELLNGAPLTSVETKGDELLPDSWNMFLKNNYVTLYSLTIGYVNTWKQMNLLGG